MKKIITIFVAVILAANVFAQAPQMMTYQSVVRNSSGILIANAAIGVRITILKDSTTGTAVYQEIFNPNPQTNANGLLSIQVGGGIPTLGTFASINWGSAPYFIKTETDPAGGTSYSIVGISQLLSVPYALYSSNTANGWNLFGNNGTNSATNFIGTIDNVPFSFRVNNKNAGRINPLLNNTSFGYHALDSNTTGHDNTAIGLYSLHFNDTAIENTALGAHALYSNTTGNYNTASGVFALNFNTMGTFNTATGFLALYSNITGNNNTANGISALNINTSGSNNVAVGFGALRSNRAGDNNTAIGKEADVTSDSLTNAIAIGYNAKVSSSNSLVLGGTGADAVRVGIGTTTPKSQLDVIGGDVNIETIGSGIIIKSPNGNCWRVTIDNSGNLLRTAITCP